MKSTYNLSVALKTPTWSDVFSKTYRVAIWDELIKEKPFKEHSFAGYVRGLVTQVKLNSLKLEKMELKKRQIYAVNCWTSVVGSEIAWVRPALIYTDTDDLQGEDVSVIPLTSAYEKAPAKHDLFLEKDTANKLYQNSYLRLRQICPISLKRIGKLLGEISSESIRKQINDAVCSMFAVCQ